MKNKLIYTITGLVTVLFFSSCIKQLDKTFQGSTVVEIDATPLHSNIAGATYPVITRIPVSSRPVSNALDSTLRRLNNTTIPIRINLVGPQSDIEQTVGFKIFTTPPVSSIAFAATLSITTVTPQIIQTPTAPAATLSLVGGVSGTHFSIVNPGGLIRIPANSSYGYLNVTILNNGPTAGQARFLGIQLDSSGTLMPNPNYNKLGLAIDQR